MWTVPPVLLAAGQGNATWYLLPLALAISLVYSASRYEMTERILRRAARLFVTILVFMGAVFVLLLLLSFNL